MEKNNEKLKERNYDYITDNYQYYSSELIYIDTKNENIKWIYYNPDSTAGGQFVEMNVSFALFENAINEPSTEDCICTIYECSKTYLIDIDADNFRDYANDLFDNKPDIIFELDFNNKKAVEIQQEKLIKLINEKLNAKKVIEGEKEEVKNTVVINGFGGPGAGKTTACFDIISELKKRGYVADYVPEYATELVWDNNLAMLNGTEKNQTLLFEEQKHRIDRLIGKVDFVVTDSPLLLNITYIKELTKEFEQMVRNAYSQYNNFNFFIERDDSNFTEKGRIHNLEESKIKDKEILNMLSSYDLYYGTYTHDTVDKIIDNAIHTYNRTNENQNGVKDSSDKEKPPINSFDYQMLGRLKSDCDYYLGNGGRCDKHLWAGNVTDQIKKMKEIYNSFNKDAQPEWLTYEQILDYEKKLKNDEPKQRLFVDMDGTLAEFKNVDTLETLYEKGYFENLKPINNVLSAVKEIIEKHPEMDVYILSAYLSDSNYALDEKQNWLDKYLPEIDDKHRLFMPCGKDKKQYIPNGIRSNDFLLDDYTNNLTLWQPPAKGIKLLNGINHSHGTWQDDRISYKKTSNNITNDIINIMQGNTHVHDIIKNNNARSCNLNEQR